MLITLIVIIGLSILILGHEAGHFFVAKAFGLKIDEFGFGFPPRIFAKKKGETEYSLNWLPFGGFVKIAGESDHLGETEIEAHISEEEKKRIFLYQPAWKKALITVAGVVMNFILGWILLVVVLMVGTPAVVFITDVQKDSPAALAGIKAGDVIQGFTATEEFINFINTNQGKEVEVRVRREGGEMAFAVTPRVPASKEEGSLGVGLANGGSEGAGFFTALKDGFIQAGIISWYTLVGFFDLIANLFQGRVVEGVVGPVGIFGVAQQTGQIGLIYLIRLISLISLNLAVINLVPFPALDGGRLFLLAIEKIKGSPLSRKTEMAINSIGFAVLLILMVLITVHDIVR